MLRKWTWTQETTHKRLQATGFLIYEVRAQAKCVSGGRSHMRRSWKLEGTLREDTRGLSDMTWAWLLSCVHAEKLHHTALDISALYSHSIIIFTPYASPSFCLSTKTKTETSGEEVCDIWKERDDRDDTRSDN